MPMVEFAKASSVRDTVWQTIAQRNKQTTRVQRGALRTFIDSPGAVAQHQCCRHCSSADFGGDGTKQPRHRQPRE